MIQPLVSVITIVYNGEKDVERTIYSVINQTYRNIEYIIVDGGSKDSTVDIIRSHENHIIKWISESDKGIYDAMNKGIKMASGEWLVMMNAGDIFADENVLENIFSSEISDNISFLYSDVFSLRPNRERILRPLSYEKGNLIHQAIIYRRSLHNEHGFYIVTKKLIISDYLFFMRIPTEQVRKINTVIAVYEGDGVSAQGNWACQQALCADVVFRRRAFWRMFFFYCWKQTKAIIPIETKDKLKIFYHKMIK